MILRNTEVSKRDGQPRETPIVPDHQIRIRYGEDEDDVLLIAASHDAIQMFPTAEYSHLRYWDPEDSKVKVVWLPQDVLADLADAGIPVTPRETITEAEFEAYNVYCAQVGGLAVAATEASEPEEYHLSDAEIDYFIGEWEQGA